MNQFSLKLEEDGCCLILHNDTQTQSKATGAEWHQKRTEVTGKPSLKWSGHNVSKEKHPCVQLYALQAKISGQPIQ